MEFREWLRQQLWNRGWVTLGEGELHLGVSKSMLSRYLRGLERPDLRTARRIANGLDADLAEIEKMLAPPEPASFTDWVLMEFNRLSEPDRQLALALVRTIADQRGRPKPTVNTSPPAGPPSDRSRLEQLAVPGKARSYMAVA